MNDQIRNPNVGQREYRFELRAPEWQSPLVTRWLGRPPALQAKASASYSTFDIRHSFVIGCFVIRHCCPRGVPDLLGRATLLLLILMITGTGPTALHADASEEAASRIWILPLTHAGEAPEEDGTGVAIAEILTVLISHSTGAEVLDRDHIDRVLAEHSLSQK